MEVPPSPPMLDLAALLATKVFSEEDLAHNRRGVLSPAQDAWRLAHPKFMDQEGDDRSIEMLVGRIVVEGRYLAARMGETTFAQLVRQGRRLSLPPGIEKSLPRDAPYRAYTAYGWIWSIEPITEDELRVEAIPLDPYRSPAVAAGVDDIGRALLDALSLELSFTEEDVVANKGGRFSPSQRGVGRKKLFFGILRLLIASIALTGIVALLVAGAPFPVFATIFGLASLGAFWATSAWALVDAVARLVHLRPLSAIAWLDNDPTNRDNVVLRTEARPIKVKRVAVAIDEAPLSALGEWRFQVFFLPWTKTIVNVRPISPKDPARAARKRAKRATRADEPS